jgi:hypothetical protein
LKSVWQEEEEAEEKSQEEEILADNCETNCLGPCSPFGCCFFHSFSRIQGTAGRGKWAEVESALGFDDISLTGDPTAEATQPIQGVLIYNRSTTRNPHNTSQDT